MAILLSVGGVVVTTLLWLVLRAKRCSCCGCGTQEFPKSS